MIGPFFGKLLELPRFGGEIRAWVSSLGLMFGIDPSQ